MATLTASLAQSNIVPRKLETGVWAVHSSYTYTAAADASAGDIILMAKIPHGATVLAVQRNFTDLGASTTAGTVLNVGFWGGNSAQSISALGSATGASGVAFLTKGLPTTVSVSDAATDRFAYLAVKVVSSGTTTAAGSIALTVFCTSDP